MVDTPNWLSKEFLEGALKKYFASDNIKICEYTSSPAIPIGENFTSDLLRIFIIYTTSDLQKHNVSVIAKCCPNNEMLMNYIRNNRLFEQEINVYVEVFPAIKKMLASRSTVVDQLSAKCVQFIKEPEPAIILEDLTSQGFKMYPRQKGLDLQHSLLAVEKLAYFHALTATVFIKQPSLLIKYDLGIYWDNSFTIRWITTGFKELIAACQEWPGYEKYSIKLKHIQNEVLKKSFTAAKPNLEKLNVLNHGDAWINNFMFLYSSDGVPTDMRLIDFQVPVLSSPALDFNYFWATSPNIEVRNNFFSRIWNHYYTTFASALTTMNYPLNQISSREEFKKELDSRAFYGAFDVAKAVIKPVCLQCSAPQYNQLKGCCLKIRLTAAVTVLPLVAASQRDDATFDDLFEENGSKDGFRYDAYNNERYKKYMQYLLPFYDSLGILD